ncbi:phage tail protein [Streptosporangium sp. G12]
MSTLSLGELHAIIDADDKGFDSAVDGAERALQSLQANANKHLDSLAENLDFDAEFNAIVAGFGLAGDGAEDESSRISAAMDVARDSFEQAGNAAAGTAKAVALIGIATAVASAGVLGIAGGLTLGVAGLGAYLAMSKEVKAEFADFGKQALTAFQKAAEPLQGPMLAGLEKLATKLEPLGEALGKAFEKVAPLIDTVFNTAITVIDSFIANLPAIIDAGMPVATFLVTTLGGAISGFLNFVTWATQKIDDFKAAFSGSSGPLSEWGAKISEIVGKAKAIFNDVFTSVSAWVAENQGTITAWGDAIKSGFDSMLAAVSSALDAIKALWDTWGSTILAALGSLVSGLLGAWNGLWQAIKGVWDVFAGIFTGDWSRVWDGLKNIVVGVWNALYAIVEGAGRAIQGILNKAGELFKSAMTAAWEGLKTLATNAWNKLTTIISEGVTKAVTFMKELPGKIKAGLGNLGELLVQAGRDLIAGLVNGIKNMAGAAIDAAKSVVKNATDAVTGFLDSHSPSKLYEGIGENTIQGWINGVLAKGALAVTAVKTVMKNAKAAAEEGFGDSRAAIDAAITAAMKKQKAAQQKVNLIGGTSITDSPGVAMDGGGGFGGGSAPGGVTINMPNAVIRESADIPRLGAQFGFEYTARA